MLVPVIKEASPEEVTFNCGISTGTGGECPSGRGNKIYRLGVCGWSEGFGDTLGKK